MKFLNPTGLWLLLLIPVLILIYIIRARHEERAVSSTFIWKLSARFMKKRLPFRKLRKILLFACQLLMLAAVAILTARPAIVAEGEAREYVLILDASASMNIENSKGESRFERAADMIQDLASESFYGTKFSVILASEEASCLVQRTDSPSELRIALNSAVCGNNRSDITSAISLAQEFCDENPVTDVILFSDIVYEETEGITVVNVSEREYNVSFTSLTYEKGNEGFVFTGEVYSSVDGSINVALSADGTILDVKRIDCTADAPVTVTFEADYLESFNVASIYTDAKDGMEEDNSYSVCRKRDEKIKVLIVSDSPFYLRSLFNSLENCSVTVTSPDNLILLAYGGFGLYVLDGAMPVVLPSDGSVWMFAPPTAPDDMALTGKFGSESALTLTKGNKSALATSLSSKLMLRNASVQSYSRIVAGKSWESLFSCGNDTVLFAKREKNGTKKVVFAFDLHDSNLPLLSDYVLLMSELLDYSFPEMLSDTDYNVSEGLEVSVLPLAEKLYVKTAEGRLLSLSTKTATASMIPDEVGVYTAAQVLSTGETKYADFFVHLPDSEMTERSSSNQLHVELLDLEQDVGIVADDAIREIRFWVILALFILILAEWGVYYYEQF